MADSESGEIEWIAKVDLLTKRLKFLDEKDLSKLGSELEDGNFCIVKEKTEKADIYTLYRIEEGEPHKVAEIRFEGGRRVLEAVEEEYEKVMEEAYRNARTYRTTSALIELARHIVDKEGKLPPIAKSYSEYQKEIERLRKEGVKVEEDEDYFMAFVRGVAMNKKFVDVSLVFKPEELGEKVEEVAHFNDPVTGKSGEAYITEKGVMVVYIKSFGEKPVLYKMYFPREKLDEYHQRLRLLREKVERYLEENGISIWHPGRGGEVMVSHDDYNYFEVTVQKWSDELIQKLKSLGGKYDPALRTWKIPFPPGFWEREILGSEGQEHSDEKSRKKKSRKKKNV